MKKIVVACDSFKGSVSSLEVARSVEAGIYKVFPDCEVLKFPLADGGEGTMAVLVKIMNGRIVSCPAHDPLMRPIQAEYGLSEDGKTAVIELATASGLTLVSEDKRNPMRTTTYGTGELIKDALFRGCTHFLLGIGGSATNDAGVGMLQALGFRFLDKEGRELGTGGQILASIHSIDRLGVLPQLRQASFTIACDVDNPFSGEKGAAYVYARQKGADAAMIDQLDKGLKHFAAIVKASENKEIDTQPGAGAAGGLGGGCIAFLEATLKSGVQMVLEALDFDRHIQNADLIITGEGRLDRQTGMGKAPAGVLEAGRNQQIPVIALGGSVEDTEELNRQGFQAVLPIQPGPVSLEQAMDKTFACRQIERTVEQLMRIMK